MIQHFFLRSTKATGNVRGSRDHTLLGKGINLYLLPSPLKSFISSLTSEAPSSSSEKQAIILGDTVEPLLHNHMGSLLNADIRHSGHHVNGS